MNNPWLGYLIVAVLLFIFGAIAGFVAARFFKKGAPPTPQMAIEEAQLIKETVTAPIRRRRRARTRERVPDGPARTPEEIRQSIEANRAELGVAVERLRGEVAKATDWRGQFQRHKREVMIGAAVAGFVVGGGIAAFTGLLTGRRKSREYDW